MFAFHLIRGGEIHDRSRYKINIVTLVPSMLHQIATSGALEKADLRTVWSMGTGAAYLPPKVEDKIMSAVKHAPRMAQGTNCLRSRVMSILDFFNHRLRIVRMREFHIVHSSNLRAHTLPS